MSQDTSLVGKVHRWEYMLLIKVTGEDQNIYLEKCVYK
jgi:hypothetical protein